MPTDRENLDDEDEIKLPEDDEQEGSDAGSLDDESGDESEAGQEPEDAQGSTRVAGRASTRIQALRREAQEARERTALLERELEQERSRRQQPQQPQEESDEVFNARVAMLEPEARINARIERSEKRHQRELLITRMAAADAADRAAFQARAAYDPRYKKYGDQVERVLAEERRQGRDFPRDTVLKFVLGEAVLNSKTKPRQQQDGQRRIAQQQARADSGRSDVSTNRQRTGQGNSLADLERRLDGVII